MESRPMTKDEQKYTFQQSQQISMQTGFIGYLRGDMGSTGDSFYSTWNDFRKDLKTQEFKDEFDTVINTLREKGNVLSSRAAIAKYCYSTPESDFHDSRNYYGLRVDTEKYAYLCRLNPNQGDYNLYCHCYVRDWLNGHMEKASGGIRFIDSNYHDLFRIEDGGNIIVRGYDGEENKSPCRYIDQTHVEIGYNYNLYHICEWAERMEQSGATYRAEKPMLPEQCYATLHTGDLIIVKYGEKGYYNTDIENQGKDAMKELANEMNKKLGVTKAQASAMLAGSMYGWSCPAANPKSYEDNGTPIKPKQSDRGDAR